MFKDWYTLKKEYDDMVGIKEDGYFSKNISTSNTTNTTIATNQKFSDAFEDVSYFIHRQKSTVKSFFTSLKNFWKFRKIIWRDRFWDYSFLIDIIVFKLKDMEERWVKYTHYEGDAFTKGRISVIRKKFEELDEKLMKIEEKHINRCLRITLDEERREEWKKCKKEAQKEIDAVFLLLARNYRKFWD